MVVLAFYKGFSPIFLGAPFLCCGKSEESEETISAESKRLVRTEEGYPLQWWHVAQRQEAAFWLVLERDCWQQAGRNLQRMVNGELNKIRLWGGILSERELERIQRRNWGKILLICGKEGRARSQATLCLRGAFQVWLLCASGLVFSHYFILIFCWLTCWLVWIWRVIWLFWLNLILCTHALFWVFFGFPCTRLMHGFISKLDIWESWLLFSNNSTYS